MEKIAIDSLAGLIDYIVEYDLDHNNKSQLRELENTVGLHFSLGMYIRNHYELSDPNQVPNLLSEFKISWIESRVEQSDESYEDALDMYEFWYEHRPLDDEISGHIAKKIWRKLRAE